MSEPPKVHLALSSQAGSVTVVRALLSGVAERLGLSPELLADMKTAVSEACNNVVMHAYGSEPGSLEVDLELLDDAVQVTVSDHGSGAIDPAPAEDRMGVGLAVIGALAPGAEFLARPGGGTAVRMLFPRPPGTPGEVVTSASAPIRPAPAAVGGEVRFTVSPVGLLEAVLGRVAGCVATEARFSIDRYSDLRLVTDEIAAHAARHSVDGQISVGFQSEPRQLQVAVGPLREAPGREGGRAGGAVSLLTSVLVDEVQAEPTPEGDVLRVVLSDPQEPDSG